MKKVFLIGLLGLSLCGCVQDNIEPIYQWSDFENSIRQTLDGSQLNKSLVQEFYDMESMRLTYIAQNKVPPPGFYAHLGLLHEKRGNFEEMNSCFQNEMRLYSESEHFMNFLLSRSDKSEEDL